MPERCPRCQGYGALETISVQFPDGGYYRGPAPYVRQQRAEQAMIYPAEMTPKEGIKFCAACHGTGLLEVNDANNRATPGQEAAPGLEEPSAYNEPVGTGRARS